VLLVTKSYVSHGATAWAQGGIAAALHPLDSPEQHLQDTLAAGVGLSDPEAVRVMVSEGPDRVRELIELGAQFDMLNGELAMTREGGHLRSRVIHAADATGAEVERALVDAVHAAPEIELIEHALVLDLLMTAGERDGEGKAARACGLSLHVLGEGSRDGVGAVRARAVVLATGGMGQMFAATTNPSVSTGDGVALALRAGAIVQDMEFVQFHPTALHLTDQVGQQQPLITEAMRGEGAVLLDAAGRRIMAGVHPLADLAPRDVVAKTMSRVMAEQGVDHLYLDARALGEAKLLEHFPTIVARCREEGIDPVRAPIPVSPAAHYASGGIRTDLEGRTSIPGCSPAARPPAPVSTERTGSPATACSKVSSSPKRICEVLATDLPEQGQPVERDVRTGLVDAAAREEIARTMTEGAGVLRSAASLAATAKALAVIEEQAAGEDVGPASWEATNLLTVATVLTHAAALREETRGGHWREDFPDARPEWLGHISFPARGGRHVDLDVHARRFRAERRRLDRQLRRRRRKTGRPMITSEWTHALLAQAGLEPSYVEALVKRAIDEDLDGGVDVTSVATVPFDQVAVAHVVTRAAGVVAGLPVAVAVLDAVTEGAVEIDVLVDDGDRVAKGEVLLTAIASTRQLLTAERTLLNLLCHLSGIATVTRQWADVLEGSGAQVRDTRKTTPGLRLLEKYAVRCGGGLNHRMSLSDAALVRTTTSSRQAASPRRSTRSHDVSRGCGGDRMRHRGAGRGGGLRGRRPRTPDNMSVEEMREAVRVTAGRARLEASGGLTLATARRWASAASTIWLSVPDALGAVLDIGVDLELRPPQQEG
jgi:nicotinate-nucleotide pyrophosphorylase (carboxylating)